eukprot:1105097-Prymnesium_polylepis.1
MAYMMREASKDTTDEISKKIYKYGAYVYLPSLLLCMLIVFHIRAKPLWTYWKAEVPVPAHDLRVYACAVAALGPHMRACAD